MAVGATGTPTALGIPKYATGSDAPSGQGFNSAMDVLDTLIVQAPRSGSIAGIAVGSVPVWNGSTWVKPTGTPDGTKFLRDDGAWAAPSGGASVTPFSLTSSSGGAFWTVDAMSASGVRGTWHFPDAATSVVYGHVLVPDGVTSANIRAVTTSSATTGNATFQMLWVAVADGESLAIGSESVAFNTEFTVGNAAYKRKDVVSTSALTGLVSGDLLVLRFARIGNGGNDTLATDLLFLGAWLEPA